MSKLRITHRQQFNKLLKESGLDSDLRNELLAVQASMSKPRYQAVTELIKLLKASTEHKVQHFISDVFGTAKDERVVQALIKLAQMPDNTNYRCNFLWPLAKYDCTKHISFFVGSLHQTSS